LVNIGHELLEEVINAVDAIEETVKYMLDNPIELAQFPAYRDQFDYDAEDKLIGEYRSALLQVVQKAGRTMPEGFHVLPHPKKPNIGPDERGR
jgi:hypothetical protein